MSLVIINLITGISFGFVLFLVAVGFSIIFGLMGILNLAHGALYMIAAFVGYTAFQWSGNYGVALIAGAVTAGLVGLLLERGFLSRLHGQVLGQILLTFGFVYIITNFCLWVWGPYPKDPFGPAIWSGSIPIVGFFVPTYRFAIMAVGMIMAVALWWFQEKTKIGSIVRAGMDDRQMVSGLGINIGLLYAGVFLLGAVVVGIAAIIGAPLFGANLNQGIEVLLYGFVVVIVGGVGSIQGALVGAILIGIIDALGKVYLPGVAMITIYVVMVVILLVRPQGLLGRA
jgi:branched-chain amino acid transport system permease protein